MVIGIIEDDKLLRKALDRSLKNQGYTTILAASRKEAIKNIDSSVDLLIVDIGLPDGDGINLYQELQKNGKIPAIFLTAKDDEKDMLKAFDTGADDYVVKNISVSPTKTCFLSEYKMTCPHIKVFSFDFLFKTTSIRFSNTFIENGLTT